MSDIRIALADDQAMIRSGLALVLAAETDLRVVAEYAHSADLVAGVRADAPDVVLTDIRMPVMDGVEAARAIRALPTSPPVLVLTTFDDDDVLWPALAAGVSGFVLKDSPPESLVAAVRTVAAGGVWLDPRVMPRVRDRAVRSLPARAGSDVLARLTPRERDVLDGMCRGLSNAEIAARLHFSERTVKAHVSAILQKFDARDRAGAIVVAFEAGWRRD